MRNPSGIHKPNTTFAILDRVRDRSQTVYQYASTRHKEVADGDVVTTQYELVAHIYLNEIAEKGLIKPDATIQEVIDFLKPLTTQTPWDDPDPDHIIQPRDISKTILSL